MGERRSGIPGALLELGAEVVLDSLPAGDYLVAPATLVERKTVSDLHRSVATGRLWDQLQKLRARADRAWLLVEGEKLDAGQITSHGVRGALLAVIDTGIPILWSTAADESALWLVRLAARARSSRAAVPWVMRAPRHRSRADAVRLLCEIRGISPRLAVGLLQRFGSIGAIASASETDLMSIEGIGKARARAVRMCLAGTSRASEKCPAARSVVVRATPGGVSAACSGRAVPRHLGGSP